MRRDLGRCVAEVHDLGVAEAAEAETEVERRSRDEDEIGFLQRDRARAREGEARDRRGSCPDPCRSRTPARRAASANATSRVLGVRPVHVAAREQHRPFAPRRRAAPTVCDRRRVRTPTRAASTSSTAGRSTEPGPNASSGMSTNVGPRCGVRAATHAASNSRDDRSRADVAVAARFTTGATIGTWSSSCSEPGAPAALRARGRRSRPSACRSCRPRSSR